MANRKITELNALTGANATDTDVFAIVDVSADETKKMTLGELKEAFDSGSGFVRITGDTMTGDLELSGADVTFGDNDKAIFGAGSDLQIYHAGSYSMIEDTGSGNLIFRTDGTSIFLQGGSETMAVFTKDGASDLYYDNSKKLATTSTGVDVTGTITSDGLTVDGTATINNIIDMTGSTANYIKAATSGGDLRFITNQGGANKQRVIIANSGDISFYEDTGTTPKMVWKSADERLGIGTSSPQENLHISSTSGSSRIRMTSADGSDNMIVFGDASDSATGAIKYDHSDNSLSFNGFNNSERMRIDSSGNVGINASTVSPIGSSNTTLQINGANTTEAGCLRLRSTNGGVDAAFWANSSAAYFGTISNDPLTFRVNNSEAARLDASGNLLVGRTSSSGTAEGIRLLNDGFGGFHRDSAEVIQVDRKTNDGTLINLLKDGSSVGSIGTASSRLVIGTSNVGAYFASGNIGPWNTSTNTSRDNAIDLGSSSGRWKDLYLSGTIEIENGLNNVGVGKNALRVNTGNYNTALGFNAGYSTVTGNNNTYIGVFSGENSTGSGNTFVGDSTGYLVTGSKNTILGRYNGNQGGLDIRTSSNNIVLSDGDGNPRVHVNSSGTLMMATTNPDVCFSSTETGIAMQTGAQVHLSSSGTALILNHPNNVTGTIQQFRYNGSTVGTISNTSSSTSYNTSSDHRLKENVVELTGATDRLKQLNPSRFNFIADADTTVDGFIAHEVQAVVPEAITGTKDAVDADGNPEYQGIDQSKLVPLLVATIKELEARITALENA